MELEITPEPDATERRAILAAVQAEEAQPRRPSAWTEAWLPQREEPGEAEP